MLAISVTCTLESLVTWITVLSLSSICRSAEPCTHDPDLSAKCESIPASYCNSVDVFQNYNYTSFPNAFGSGNLADAEAVVRGNRHIVDSNCSTYAAHYLCTAAYPFCEPGVARSVGPCRELCEEVQHSCDMDILDCDIFPRYGTKLCVWNSTASDCSLDSVTTKSAAGLADSSTSVAVLSLATCDGYLIMLNNLSGTSFGDKKNCVDPCRSVYFESHQNSLLVICMMVINIICFVVALFAAATFIFNFKTLRKLESPIYYAALCYMGLSIANIISVTVGRGDLICDSSVLNSFNETAVASDERTGSLCYALFSLAYFFTLGTWVWWCASTVLWFAFSMGAKSISMSVTVVVHAVCWGVPVLFVLLALWKGEIAGDPITQTCWIGKNQGVWFVVVPLAIAILFCSILVLLRFSFILSPNHKKKLREMHEATPTDDYRNKTPHRTILLRMKLYILLTLSIMGVLFCSYFYDFWYRREWDNIYLRCSSEPSIQSCTSLSDSDKPSLPVYLAQIVASVAMGLLTVLFIVRKDLMSVWKRTFCFYCDCNSNGSPRLSEIPSSAGVRQGQLPVTLKLEEEPSDSTTV